MSRPNLDRIRSIKTLPSLFDLPSRIDVTRVA